MRAWVPTDGRGQDEAVVGVGLQAGARAGSPVHSPGPRRRRARDTDAQPAALPLRYAVSISTARISDWADQPVADPVVALVAAAAGLPAVVHLAGAARLDGVGGGRVEEVGGVLDPAAVLQGDHVEGAERGQPRRVRARPRRSTRSRAMPPSGCWLTRRCVKRCSTSTAKPLAAWPPTGVRGTSVVHFTSSREQFLGRRGSRRRQVALDGDRLRVVAAEVGGVDDDAADHAGRAEPDQRPVVVLGGRPGLRRRETPRRRRVSQPSMILPLWPKCSGSNSARPGQQQVLALGEELVVGGDDAGAEPPVGEVGVGG